MSLKSGFFAQDAFYLGNTILHIFQAYIFMGNFKHTLCLYNLFHWKYFYFISWQKKKTQTLFNYPSLTYSQQDSYMPTENTYDRGKQTETI